MIKIGILGCGTIGGGVIRLLESKVLRFSKNGQSDRD